MGENALLTLQQVLIACAEADRPLAANTFRTYVAEGLAPRRHTGRAGLRCGRPPRCALGLPVDLAASPASTLLMARIDAGADPKVRLVLEGADFGYRWRLVQLGQNEVLDKVKFHVQTELN